jgi:hypothetical protein
MFSFVNIPARILAILELNISPVEVAYNTYLYIVKGFPSIKM